MERRVAGRERRGLRHREPLLRDQRGELGLGPVGDLATTEITEPVRAVGERHQAHLGRDVVERHPHRDGVLGVERPVELVLVPRRPAPARLFEQGLGGVD
jgi:hypothetical protein